MKFLVIGDFHGKFPKKLKKYVKEVDVILADGDFGGSDKLLKVIFKYFYGDWVEEVGEKKAKKLILEDYNSGKKIINELGKLKIPIYTIHGNWDFEGYRRARRYGHLKLKNYSHLIKKKKNMVFLKRKMIDLDGLKLYAFGGYMTPIIYTRKEGGFDKKKKEKYKKQIGKEKKAMFKKGQKDIDIFLAHYTPYGYFDKVRYKGKNPMNGKHVGIQAYTDFIKKYQPRVFVCGHMHEYQGMKKLGKTTIVATGPASNGKAAVIDVPNDKKKKVKVKFIR